MMRSLYSAVSGLKTHQTRMDVIGNNIANVNTEAFKSSSVTFSEIMYQTVSGASAGNGATGTGGVNAKQIGLGVSTGSTTVSIETAGAAETTGNPFDLKLTDSQTTNFFIVSDGTNTMFTRAGSFYVDGNGYLCMSSTGYTLMGWQVDPTTGEIRKDTVSALQVMSPGNQTSQPEATKKAYVSGVLDKNDPNLSNEEGYVLALSLYDSLGYGYTGKFKVTPALDKNGEIKNAGEYHIELTDILDQAGTSILKDPTDPTGETFLPNMDPGRFFSTGEVEMVDVTTAQVAYDSSGNKYPIINLGTSTAPALFVMDNFKNFYKVKENGAAFETELSEDNMAYMLVTDKDGNAFYVDPNAVDENILPSKDNVYKNPDTGKNVYANGTKTYYYIAGSDTANPSAKELYKISEDGKTLYAVSKNPFTDEYEAKTDAAAKLYTFMGTPQEKMFLTSEPTDLTIGTEIDDAGGYSIREINGEFYGIKDGKIYKATKNVQEIPESYTYASNNEITDVTVIDPDASDFSDIFTVSTLVHTDNSIEYYKIGDDYYAMDKTDTLNPHVYQATYTASQNDVTYTVDDSNILYLAVQDLDTDGATMKYIEPEYVIYAAEDKPAGNGAESGIRIEGQEVYKINNKFYVKDKDTQDLYEIEDTSIDPSLWESKDTPAYVAYKDGQKSLVYLEADVNLLSKDSEYFKDLDNKAYTTTKTVEKYTPYTIVFDQNNGKFVSCGVDNQAEGSSLMLNMADVIINRVVTDPDGDKNIFTSEDGFTTSNFSNIEIDFSKSMNYNNSGTSTMKALKGDTQGDGTGKKLGALTGLTVDNSGKIYGSYDNGNTVLLCQIACAQFANASGLEKVGENCYATTLNSGEFDGIGVEVDADGSSISTGELEMSNVDLSAEFTSMIITQRGFQANSRIITTSDTLLEELINLKR